MKKWIYKVFYALTLVTGVTTLYLYFSGQYLQNLKLFGLGVFETMFFGVVSIMLENRPRNTEAQKRFDDRAINNGAVCLLLLTGLLIVVIVATI
jgi:hypothetical protein